MVLALYTINTTFVSELSQIDPKVMSNIGKKETRPFVGILITIGELKYLAPLSSPKNKHKSMKNNLDFIKIVKCQY